MKLLLLATILLFCATGCAERKNNTQGPESTPSVNCIESFIRKGKKGIKQLHKQYKIVVSKSRAAHYIDGTLAPPYQTYDVFYTKEGYFDSTITIDNYGTKQVVSGSEKYVYYSDSLFVTLFYNANKKLMFVDSFIKTGSNTFVIKTYSYDNIFFMQEKITHTTDNNCISVEIIDEKYNLLNGSAVLSERYVYTKDSLAAYKKSNEEQTANELKKMRRDTLSKDVKGNPLKEVITFFDDDNDGDSSITYNNYTYIYY